MRPSGVARNVMVLMLLACGLQGCSVSRAEQDEVRKAWAARDAERERECQRAMGSWKDGACIFSGGGAGSM